jgi:hypothetical protein
MAEWITKSVSIIAVIALGTTAILVKERHLAQATQVDIVDVRKPIAASFINDRQVYEYLLHPPPSDGFKTSKSSARQSPIDIKKKTLIGVAPDCGSCTKPEVLTRLAETTMLVYGIGEEKPEYPLSKLTTLLVDPNDQLGYTILRVRPAIITIEAGKVVDVETL